VRSATRWQRIYGSHRTSPSRTSCATSSLRSISRSSWRSITRPRLRYQSSWLVSSQPSPCQVRTSARTNESARRSCTTADRCCHSMLGSGRYPDPAATNDTTDLPFDLGRREFDLSDRSGDRCSQRTDHAMEQRSDRHAPLCARETTASLLGSIVRSSLLRSLDQWGGTSGSSIEWLVCSVVATISRWREVADIHCVIVAVVVAAASSRTSYDHGCRLVPR